MISGAKGVAIKQISRGGAIGRRRNSVEVPGAAVETGLIRDRRIGDGATPPEHRLRVDLVGDSEVRSEGKRVGVGELTLACRLISYGAKPSTDQRVRQVEGRVLHAAILLLPQGGVIPAQTVVEGQFTGYFPTVLEIDSIGMRT